MSNYIRVNMEISDLIHLIEKYNENCRKWVNVTMLSGVISRKLMNSFTR